MSDHQPRTRISPVCHRPAAARPAAARARRADRDLQQIYLDNFNSRAHEHGEDTAPEDNSAETTRAAHAAGWAAVIEHMAHAHGDEHAAELLGPHPVLEPDASKAWVAHFGDDGTPVASAAGGGGSSSSSSAAAPRATKSGGGSSYA